MLLPGEWRSVRGGSGSVLMVPGAALQGQEVAENSRNRLVGASNAVH